MNYKDEYESCLDENINLKKEITRLEEALHECQKEIRRLRGVIREYEKV